MSRLAVTMGDPAGVGPEVLLKTLALSPSETDEIVIIGSKAWLERTAVELGLPIPRWTEVQSLEALSSVSSLAIYDPSPIDAEQIQPGRATEAGGRASVQYFESAVEGCMDGSLSGVVTCPINKVSVQLAGYVQDIGHQEILARLTGSRLTATLLMTRGLKSCTYRRISPCRGRSLCEKRHYRFEIRVSAICLESLGVFVTHSGCGGAQSPRW